MAGVWFQPGAVFEGYTIERLLATGGMGAVYLARHPRLPRLVALKLLLDESVISPRHLGATANDERLEGRRRFVREATLVAALEHPNIVHIHDFSGPDSETLWISMRYVTGGDAAELLTREGGRLTPDRAVRLTAQAARGLDHAHRNRILHRDVKPLNLLMDRDGDEERVVVSDFGIARGLDATRSAKAPPLTYAYAAPERFDSQVEVDHRADVYSLGCTLYEFLTGSTPYPARDVAAVMGAHLTAVPPRPSEHVGGLPPGLDQVIATALAKRPGDRFATCTELAAAAEAALGSRPSSSVVKPRPVPAPVADPVRAGTPKPVGSAVATTADAAPERPWNLKPGSRFKYFVIEKVIPSEGDWYIFAARRTGPGLVVLKIWPGYRSGTKPELLRRYLRDVTEVATLGHPNIVAVYDQGQIYETGAWIAMQYISGETTLEAVLDQQTTGIPADRAVRMVQQIATGLDDAHQHDIVHGTLDPSNILLRDGKFDHALVTDFGGTLLPGATRVGYPRLYWVSPEVLNQHHPSARTDVYHLGCVLYYALTGRLPFGGQAVGGRRYQELKPLFEGHLNSPPPKPTILIPGLPIALDQVVAKALAKNPSDRYVNCIHLASAAAQALSAANPPASWSASPIDL